MDFQGKIFAVPAAALILILAGPVGPLASLRAEEPAVEAENSSGNSSGPSSGPSLGDSFWEGVAPGAAAAWAVGWRVGAELHQGEVARQTDLFEGPATTVFAEYSFSDYLRPGFEIGVADSVTGEQATEQDYTRLYGGPSLRGVLPGRRLRSSLSLGLGLYRAFAKGDLSALDQAVGFTWFGGGGVEFPLTADFTIGLDARYRRFVRGGPDAQVIELLVVNHIWLR